MLCVETLMGDSNLSFIVGILLTIAHQSYCLVRIFENLFHLD